MARIDALIEQVTDRVLRQKLELALGEIRKRQRFGLVFEEHVPETTALPGFPIKAGSTVQLRKDLTGDKQYRVESSAGRGRLNLEPPGGGRAITAAPGDLLVVKPFGEPMYSALKSVGVVRKGPEDRPHHAVINGENFHTLQLLTYLYEGQIDCIYIDPPYNTGAKDWKYNNRYVDKNDAWRHSKWLSMMEKRITIAKRLLKPDGVLICTIDEHEVNHLGMLVEKVFPRHLHYMVTIVINPKGREKSNFAPVEEYALFVVPDIGRDLIARAPNGSDSDSTEHVEEADELLDNGADDATGEQAQDDAEEANAEVAQEWEVRHARRRGGGAESSSFRVKRWGQFYPIFIDEVNKRVVRAGQAIPLTAEPSLERVDGLRPIWPIDSAGQHRVWAFIPSSMQKLIDAERVFLGRYHKKRDDWTINYRVPAKKTRKLKTVWWEKSHDAGTHGTNLLTAILGRPGLFPFPKSVYAVKDTIATVVRNRPNAIILDFFAGSGTALHATCLLNAEDGGRRRTILVTNNEVEEKTARQLKKKGLFKGDPDFEAHGIFSQATKPRCEAVITGLQPGGKEIPGKYLNGRLRKQGFEENCEFFELTYLDPDDVDMGQRFDAIFPSLWLAAGAVGSRSALTPETTMLVEPDQGLGILLSEDHYPLFRAAVFKALTINRVWIVTDSEDAFAEMMAALPSHVTGSMLYRDYLRNFRINTRQNL